MKPFRDLSVTIGVRGALALHLHLYRTLKGLSPEWDVVGEEFSQGGQGGGHAVKGFGGVGSRISAARFQVQYP